MTSGLATDDADPEDKWDRERHFPLTVLERGLQVSLKTAEASSQADRVKILNTIVGRTGKELLAPVLKSHAAYDALDDTLAGRFAAGMLRRLIEAGRKGSPPRPGTAHLPLFLQVGKGSPPRQGTAHLLLFVQASLSTSACSGSSVVGQLCSS